MLSGDAISHASINSKKTDIPLNRASLNIIHASDDSDWKDASSDTFTKETKKREKRERRRRDEFSRSSTHAFPWVLFSLMLFAVLVAFGFVGLLHEAMDGGSFLFSERVQQEASEIADTGTSSALNEIEFESRESDVEVPDTIEATTEEPDQQEQTPQGAPDANSIQPVPDTSTPAPTQAYVSAPAAPQGDGETSGPAHAIPVGISQPVFNEASAITKEHCSVDFSSAPSGYIGIKGYNKTGSKMKAQVLCGQMSYVYVLPNGGGPIFVPVNMGSGTYEVKVMLNTTQERYVQVMSASSPVSLLSETAPYLMPNVFVSYSPSSACVAKARELAAGCANQGDVVRSVYRWLTANISYDQGKANRLTNATDYIPNPDSTLSSRSGICFDYAALAAAMFRSVGIPAKVMTGYINGNVYHSWNLIYINGKWVAADIIVNPNQWNRMDATVGSTGGNANGYTERYTY